MFMSCIGSFRSIVERKEDEVVWELIYDLCICYELYRENAKSYKLISI